jgi:hypothetical protein
MRTCQKIFLLLVLLGSPAFAAPSGGFTFTKILDDAGLTALRGAALNEQGTVAITVAMEGVGDAVLVGDGRSLSIVAESAAGSFGPAAINNRGDVVFRADSREGSRILLSRNGRLSTLVGVDAHVIRDPVINARGTVAFSAFRPSVGGQAVLALDRGQVTTITTHMRAIVILDINQRGQVLALTDPGLPPASTLVVGDGRTIRIVADAHALLDGGFFFLQAAINDRGTVAFSAFLGEKGQRMYLADPQGGLRTVITSDGPFEGFRLGGLTNAGTPVFTGFLDAGGSGVFVGPDPVADKVIATGDTLDGATVLQASVADVNASGQILLWVTFEDGTVALYRTQHGGGDGEP